MIKKDIKAVHDKDLESLLTSLGIIGDIKNGKVKCKFCDKVIDLDNLEMIFPESGSIKFSCKEIECNKKLCDLIEREKVE